MAEWGTYLNVALPKAPEYSAYVAMTHPTEGVTPPYLNAT